MKKMVLIAVFALLLTLLIACGGTSNSQSNNPNTVTMGASTFNVMTITIHKGNTLTFVNNAHSASLHILAVGKDGQNDAENGAPDFGGFAGHRSEVGDSWTTPPWNTTGTYHVTCTVHPMMNLTVIVTS